MKLSDLVIESLAERGIRHLFLVSGGGIMHMVDSAGSSTRVRYVCNFHEQASVIAAEAYARVTNGVGACLVTTGPGATNALSAVPGAWFDSIPIVVLSGQVRLPLIANYERVRQNGPQEVNIIPMAVPVTKYAKTIREPERIAEELDLAFEAATSGRPGPVWIDLPLDVQATEVSASPKPAPRKETPASDELRDAVAHTVELLAIARRPMFIAGHGIRLGHAMNELSAFLARTQLPVIVPISAMDLVPESYAGHMGAFGPIGRRAANFALQNADLVVSIGASLSISATGFNTAGFAPKAKKVVVNVDPGEIEKSSLHIDLPVVADAGAFLRELLRQLGDGAPPSRDRWLAACADWKLRYPPGPPPDFIHPDYVNSYALAEELSRQMQPGEIVVGGISLDVASLYQSFRVKEGQRVLVNANYGAMGWDLPAAVGACVAADGARVVLVTGDGCIQFNIQELQTVRSNDLNLRIFVLNNAGYESIRTTQKNWFEGRFVGSDFGSGIGNPDFQKLAEAYGLAYVKMDDPASMAERVAEVLEHDGPVICEVMVSPDQPRTPRASSFRREDGTMESRPIEDLFPFLPREEVHANMHMFDDEDA
ncbi:MAG TPA: thiamine pyrophosphate-binding protein [Thermoanaerobaculia bacterium]|nr:thiamine pyrophosphate-binding protein [Thermoanaerobaculia bacterium]